jgi:hypothetical protein
MTTQNPPQLRWLLLIVFAVLGLMYLGYLFIWVPLESYNAQRASLTREIDEKQTEVNEIRRGKALLDRWRQESLPADKYLARREYERFLDRLMETSKVVKESLAPPSDIFESRTAVGAKKLVYVPLDYSIEARATLANLTEMLRRFKATPLDHKIKSLKIEPVESKSFKGPKDELKVHLVVEAIVSEGADREQPNLVGVNGRLVELDVLNGLGRGPAWMSLLSRAVPSRNYADIAYRDIFTGPQPPPQVAKEKSRGQDIRQYIYLNRITRDGETGEAVLQDRWNNNRRTVLHATPGANTFRIADSEGEQKFKAEVVKIAPRDVYYVVEQHGLFELHVGQNLAQAKRIEPRKARELGIRLPPKKDRGGKSRLY